MHAIKNDSVLGVVKFVSKYEDRQVYGKTIPDAMMSREIMETTAYKTYLAFATGKAIHKKARKRTKAATTIMKESSLTTNDNIISEDPNVALELAKPMSKTKAEEQEAARLVHETHERIVNEKPTERRRKTGVVFRDTPTVSKRKPLDKPQKLKGVQVMSEEECSSEEAGLISEVPDKPKVNSADDDKEDDNDDDQSIDLEETDDEENKHDNDETQRDEYVHEDEYVHTDDDERTKTDNEDQAMDDAEKNDEDKAEEEKDTDQEPIQDEQAKDEVAGVLVSMTHKKKPKLMISTSSQSVSSNYGNQFLISSLERSLLGTIKESTDVEITSMVDVQIQQEILSVLSAPLLDVLVFVVPPTPTNPTPPPIPTTSTITTTKAPTSTSVNPESETLSALQLRVSNLEKEVRELKQADLSTTLRASIRSEVPSAVNEYLGSSMGDALQKELQKHTEELRLEYSQKSTSEIQNIKMEHAEKQQKS
ncbi:hypothetical protein Tco_0146164 [Tanacetum coccineum]